MTIVLRYQLFAYSCLPKKLTNQCTGEQYVEIFVNNCGYTVTRQGLVSWIISGAEGDRCAEWPRLWTGLFTMVWQQGALRMSPWGLVHVGVVSHNPDKTMYWELVCVRDRMLKLVGYMTGQRQDSYRGDGGFLDSLISSLPHLYTI